jgi:hypothetical protein
MVAKQGTGVRTPVAQSAQCEVAVGTDWQLNGSLQRSFEKEAENTKRENKLSSDP